MRIVGGRLRGRALKAPGGSATRPTTDRLRERIFGILTHWHGGDAVRDARVIDLFAGTGALGLEALSRGAATALFVEDGTDARAAIRENIEALGVAGATRIFRRDATKLGQAPGDRFTLAFLDPPYGRNLAAGCLRALADGGWLAPGAVMVVEEALDTPIDAPPAFTPVDTRSQGDTTVTFFVFAAPTPAASPS